MNAHARYFLLAGPPLDRFAKLGAAMGPQDTQLVLGIGLEEVPNRGGAFPRLDDEQRMSLRELGEIRAAQPGERLP
jgi:hypothetical protein